MKKKISNGIIKKKNIYYICLSSLYEYKIISIVIKIAYIYSKNDFLTFY